MQSAAAFAAGLSASRTNGLLYVGTPGEQANQARSRDTPNAVLAMPAPRLLMPLFLSKSQHFFFR